MVRFDKKELRAFGDWLQTTQRENVFVSWDEGVRLSTAAVHGVSDKDVMSEATNPQPHKYSSSKGFWATVEASHRRPTDFRLSYPACQRRRRSRTLRRRRCRSQPPAQKSNQFSVKGGERHRGWKLRRQVRCAILEVACERRAARGERNREELRPVSRQHRDRGT